MKLAFPRTPVLRFFSAVTFLLHLDLQAELSNEGRVQVEVFEFAPAAPAVASDNPIPPEEPGVEQNWANLPQLKTDEYTETTFAFGAIPAKYNGRGIKIDRSRPYLVRATGTVTLPLGEQKLH